MLFKDYIMLLQMCTQRYKGDDKYEHEV